jgi:hypothetical protein
MIAYENRPFPAGHPAIPIVEIHLECSFGGAGREGSGGIKQCLVILSESDIGQKYYLSLILIPLSGKKWTFAGYQTTKVHFFPSSR